jgi:hypothetical protein
MRKLLAALGLSVLLLGTIQAQDIPPVKDLQIIATWDRTENCDQTNADWDAKRPVLLRYQTDKKKAFEFTVPAESIHRPATEAVRTAMRSQSQWPWRPKCLFVLHPPMDFTAVLPSGTSFLFTALAEAKGRLADQKQKPTNTPADSELGAAIAQCKKDWPADFVMQEYCIKQQTEAYRRLRGGGE